MLIFDNDSSILSISFFYHHISPAQLLPSTSSIRFTSQIRAARLALRAALAIECASVPSFRSFSASST